MMGQSKERKWGSSGSAKPHSRLPSALKRPVVESDAVGRWARPPSALRPPSARPDSRRSRPGSRMEVRPDSRLDSKPQELIRPKSGVRPLSGKVFMRRTNDHGWVAKAYNVSEPMGVQSQPELNLFDDLSDVDSLDSFFDDDFDVQTSEEKLGNLLSCNTLGVEAKGNRPDWVAGKLGIPEFHCPRCRDHWYGITDVPCDEELARLIREGLWHTGKEGVKGGNERRRRREHGKKDKDRNYRSHSSVSLSSKSSSIELHRNAESGDVKAQREPNLVSQEKDCKKPKKRITFKLDNDLEGSGSNHGSKTQLDGYGGYKRASGTKGFGDGLSSGDGRQLESSTVSSKRASSVNSVGGDVGDGRDAREGGGAGGGGVIGNQRKGTRNSHDQLESGNSGLLDDFGRRQKRTGKDYGGGVNGLMESGSGGQDGIESGGARMRHGSMGTNNAAAMVATNDGGGHGERSALRNKSDSTVEATDDSSTTTGTGREDSIHATATTSVIGDGRRNSEQRGGSTDPPSLTSSSQVRHTGGSRRGSISTEDHGRSVRKAGGYMRAVSPSASEWGDPTHARPFISSTATSRTVSRVGSAVNLASMEDESNQRLSLPPIVPAINNKKPLLDLSDLMGGLQFTRAWTFSYHK